MSVSRSLCPVFSTAQSALVLVAVRMGPHVLIQLPCRLKSFATLLTVVRLLTGMGHDVQLQVSRCDVGFPADVTLEGPVPRVTRLVTSQVPRLREAGAACGEAWPRSASARAASGP